MFVEERLVKTLLDAGVAEELRRRVGALAEEDQRRWGSMTAAEAVCHLRGAFAIANGEREATSTPPPVPRAVMKFLALRVPVRWPEGVRTVPELQRARLLVGSFPEEKRAMEEAFGRFLLRGPAARDHPIFGRMGRWDWMRWGYLHTDHHLRQFGR